MKSSYKFLKMNYNGEMKRCALPGTFGELKKTISKLFGILPEQISQFNLSFMDDEGDTVLISDEFDYNQAKLFIENEKVDVLKLTIEKLERKESNQFEIINGPTQFELIEKKENINLPKIEFTESAIQNKSNYEEGLNLEILNEIKISGDLASSEIIVNEKNEKFLNDSYTEEYKNLVENFKNSQEDKKLTDDIKIPYVNKQDFNCNNIFKKIKKKFRKIVLELKSNKNLRQEIKMKKNYNEKQTAIEKIKNDYKNKLDSLVKFEMNILTEEILNRLYIFPDKWVENILNEKKMVKTSENKKENHYEHTYVRCDGCNIKPIKGNRYLCSICDDFDYCEKCEESFKETHCHPFIKIRNESLAPLRILTVMKDDKPELNKEIINIKRNKDQIDLYINKVVDLKDFNNELKEFQNFNLENYAAKLNQNNLESKAKFDSLSSVCLTSNLSMELMNKTNEIRKTIILRNNGSQSWPKPCYLTCINEESYIKGNSNLLRIKVDPEKEIKVEICLDLKNCHKDGDYFSVWQLQNEKKEFFGDKIIFLIKVKFNEEIGLNKILDKPEVASSVKTEKFQNEMTVEEFKINLNKGQIPKSSIQKKQSFLPIVNEMKKKFDLRAFEDKNILYAVVSSDGNIEAAFDKLHNNRNICNYHRKI